MGFDSLKNLLQDAVQRASISRQVKAVSVIQVTNNLLQNILPAGRSQDARAISYRSGALKIGCLNGSALHKINQSKDVIIDYVKSEEPTADIKFISVCIMKTYPSSEL